MLGSNDPQFKPARATARALTTALNLFTPQSLQLSRGTGRTRLVSNLVAELSAPRLLSLFLFLLFLALLGGFTTNLFTTSGIKESTPHVLHMQRRLGRGVYASHSHLDHSDSMYPPAVHPESFGIWRSRTTSTTTTLPHSPGFLVENFSDDASVPVFPSLYGERVTASSWNTEDEETRNAELKWRISQFFWGYRYSATFVFAFGSP